MSAFLEYAVETLAGFLEGALPDELTAIEGATDMDPGTLKPPVAVVRAQVDNDNRAPLLAVYERRWSWLDQRNNLVSVECEVAVQIVGGVSIEAGKVLVRRYVQAICKLIQQAPRLGSTSVLEAVLIDGDADVIKGDQSSTKHVAVQAVVMHLQGAT